MENPLTKADLKSIKEALYKLNDLGHLIELLDKLGMPTDELKQKREFYLQVLSTLRTELFPNEP